MGVWKRCECRKKSRERCEHAWWASFLGKKVSLAKWLNQEVPDREAAEGGLIELRKSIRAGTFNPDGVAVRPELLTFTQFADRYWDRYVQTQKGADTAKVRIDIVKRFFGQRALTDIRPPDLDDLFTNLAKPVRFNPKHPTEKVRAGGTINRYKALVRHMFNWAVDDGMLEASPFIKRHRPKRNLENRRTRRLTSDEEQRLLTQAGDQPTFRNAIITAFDTGMRQGEMLALTIADLDVKPGWIRLRKETTKSGQARELPISTERLRQALDWQRTDAAGEKKEASVRVFCTGVGESWSKDPFIKTWNKVFKAAGVVGARWHDLRHEFASRLVERGVPLSQVRDLLGHSSITTTERYDNQRQETLLAAAQRLNADALPVSQAPGLMPAPVPVATPTGENPRVM